MWTRFVTPHLLLVALTCAQAPQDSNPDVSEIVRKSVERDWSNFARARDYTYLQDVEERRIDAQGRTESTKSRTFDVVVLGERPYRKLIAEDGRPLDPAKARKANEDFEKEIRKHQRLTENEQRKRAEKRRKQEEAARAFLREIPDAYQFELLRRDLLDGIPVWVIRAEPRSGYRPKVKDAHLLKKFRGVLWIDEKEYQWVKIEAEAIGTVSFGWVLARLARGSTVAFQQTRVNDDLWLPSKAATRIIAKLALVKTIRAEVDVRWRDYRKFRTESRIVPEERPSPASPR